MPLTPAEAAANVQRLRADLDHLLDALAPDADGRVRVTSAEARGILRDLPGHVLALVIDIID